MSLDDWNYYGDHRVIAGEREERTFTVEVDGEEVDLPTKWEVCPTCNGKGTHVNPSIDAGGLSREDFDCDPDFERDYCEGMYDVACYECKGRTTVRVIDRDRANKTALAVWDHEERERLEFEAMCRAERRMGA